MVPTIINVCHNNGVEIKFTQSARKHKIGRASALHVIDNNEPTISETPQGSRYWWEGADERGRELEIGAVIGSRDGVLLVIHVMPIDFRRK